MDPPPPPPPPHGSNPGSTGPGGGLPPGKYDIFVIPPHSAGGGFLYLPSLQPHRNSFIAGMLAALAAVGLYVVVFPIMKEWFIKMASSGGAGVMMLMAGMGVIGWAWGKTQGESGTPPPGGAGGTGGTAHTGQAGGGPGAGPTPGYGGSAHTGGAGFGAGPGAGHNAGYGSGAHGYGNANGFPGGGPYGGMPGGGTRHSSSYAPPPPPESEADHEPEEPKPPPKSSWQRAKPAEPKAPPPKPTPPPQREPGPWERAREEARKKEEERKKEAEIQRRAEELAAKKAEEEKERQRLREKEARERKEREERRAKERAEREKQKAEAEKAKAPPAPAASAKAPPPPPSHSAARSTSPKKAPPQPSARTEADEDAHSYRPYDKPRTARTYMSSETSSIFSGTSYQTQSTARSSPPPSHRGPYSTKDPDKIIIKAVYAFNNAFNNLPIAQLISGKGSVTDGLILRMTTEGLFIDDDVRGVPQREWDVKAWTMKLVEVWCPQMHATLGASSGSKNPGSASATAGRSSSFFPHLRHNAADKAPSSEESDTFLAKFKPLCRASCGRGPSASSRSERSARFDKNSNVSSSSLGDSRSNTNASQTGELKGLHVVRATIRDQEGKRYVFVLSEEESWKVAVGLQRLRKGSQVRALGVSGMPVNETKAILSNMGFL